jgi:hypothetical protein
VEHEALLVFAFQRVDDLFILAGAERGDNQSLRFAARKQGGAVRTGQDAGFGNDRADGFRVALIDAAAGFQDVAANDVGFQFRSCLILLP